MIFEWVVIGAGPAGIAAVGKLIDHGIPPKQIGWIDPRFSVGDLGLKWRSVPSNTKVGLFLKFLTDCQAFAYSKKSALEQMDPEGYCQLEKVVEPLQEVTDHLKKQVRPFTETATSLKLTQNRWEIKTQGPTLLAKKVILAIGADPKALSYPEHALISVETALNPRLLAEAVSPKDTVGVFGSSHTAFLSLANLETLKIPAINFYRSPHRYAVHFEDWILFDSTGLKGFTADWARKQIDGTPSPLLKRVQLLDPTFQEALAHCTKLIYATGFERRKLPLLESYPHFHYDDKTGLIAPHLFGMGIAFPRAKLDRLGHLEFRVGLWKFMKDLNTLLPIWLAFQ